MPNEPLHEPGYPAIIPSPATLDELHEVMIGCTRCDLFQNRTLVVPGAGDPGARLLFVGEAPGVHEDLEGEPFVGRSGKLLDEMLHAAGLSREEIFIANLVRCRPPGNRNPRTREVQACAGWLNEQIRLIQPKLVVPLGRFALQHFLPKARITKLRGTIVETQYAGDVLRLFPLLHPSAILRNPRLRPGYEDEFRELAKMDQM